jgi:hypothetical protein
LRSHKQGRILGGKKLSKLTPICHVKSDSATGPISARLALHTSSQTLHQHGYRPVITNPYTTLNHHLTNTHPGKRLEQPGRRNEMINHAATPL